MSWFPRQNVIVPVDFSDEAFAALDTALELVEQPEHVHVVHVLEKLTPMEPGMMWGSIDDQTRKQRAQNVLSDRLSEGKYKGIKIEAVVGDPGHEIADFAKSVSADLIVMPSHGRRGLPHLLIGSVAERVLRLAHCPVLVLRKPR